MRHVLNKKDRQTQVGFASHPLFITFPKSLHVCIYRRNKNMCQMILRFRKIIP